MGQTAKPAPTREEILNAAYEIFMAKGLDGAVTKEITDRAGVNKAMLYYYFDSKEQLFVEVFRKAVRESGLNTVGLLETNLPLFEKIRLYIHTITDHLLEQPDALSFVLNAVNRSPERLAPIFAEEIGFDPASLDKQMSEAADRYEIARVDTQQLLANLLTMCTGPAVHRRSYGELLDLETDEAFRSFMERRKGIIYDTIISWLTK